MIFKPYSRQSNHDNTATGRSRADAGVYSSKFMVDLVRGRMLLVTPSTGPQQLQFRERLTQEIVTQTRLRPWAMAGMLNENAALRLGLAEKLAGMLDPGHGADPHVRQAGSPAPAG